MAYYTNSDDASFYPTSSTSGEFDVYPFASQTSPTEEPNRRYSALTDQWNMVERPGPMVGSPTSLRAVPSFESVASATPHVTYANSYDQPSYSGRYWPEVGQRAQSHSGFLSRDGSFPNTSAAETSTVSPAPSNFPFGYWGENQSGPSTGTLYAENVQTRHLPSTGLTRTGVIPTRRFQPYGTSRVRSNEHRNAEAGPSTLVPPPAPLVGPPTPQPSGGISETPANAELNKTNTEEVKVPTTKRTRRPRGEGPPRPHRVKTQKDTNRLRNWVRRRVGLPEAPSLNKSLEFIVKVIPQIRPLVNQEPCLSLLEGRGERNAAGFKNADEEFDRRNMERRLLQELTRYYPLGQHQSTWTRPSLFHHIANDLENLPGPPGPSDEPAP